MFIRSRGLATACGALTLALLPTAAGAANLDWLVPPLGNPCCSRPVVTARTTYMPPYAASPAFAQPPPALGPVPAAAIVPAAAVPGCSTCAPAPCAAPAVQYVPQTCYRTVVQAVPVTAYQPVTVCDPSTGCAQTCYRPVTTVVRRAQLAPYTTYRAAYGVPACGGCATGYPIGSGAVAAPCAGCQATTSMMPAAAAYTTVPAAPADAIPSLPPGGAATIAAPAQGEPAGGGTTVLKAPLPAPQPQPQPQPQPKPEKPLAPIPQAEPNSGDRPAEPAAGPAINTPTGSSIAPPRTLDPHDRTTARPLHGAAAHQPVHWTVPAPASRPVAPTIGDDGWRAF